MAAIKNPRRCTALHALVWSSGLNQKHIAKALRIAEYRFRDFEAGRSVPNDSELRRMARFFGVTIDEISGSYDDLSDMNDATDRLARWFGTDEAKLFVRRILQVALGQFTRASDA